MQHIQVRRVAAEDLPAVAAIEARAFPGLNYPYFALRQLFDVHGEYMLAAVGPEGVHGYVLLAGSGNGRSWLLALAVDPVQREQGYGRRLLDAVLELSDDRELGATYVTVAPGNQPALRMYRAAGFRYAKWCSDHLGPGHDRILMVREAPGRES
ncbi:GNAT family N-acetyltransferase [Streptomyces zhihengii]|uniref:GNAT family N-acetyltransferase n=1 Tax=Streptomyces zhihengii TaxID=1818004 RepID=UPI0033B9D3D7